MGDASNNYHRRKNGAKVEGKIQCLLCGSWYWNVGTHVRQRHDMTAREYRELHNLEVRKGIVSVELRKKMRQNALDNNMDKQLIRAGKATRFKKGQAGVGVYERSPITIERLRRNQKLSYVKKEVL